MCIALGLVACGGKRDEPTPAASAPVVAVIDAPPPPPAPVIDAGLDAPRAHAAPVGTFVVVTPDVVADTLVAATIGDEAAIGQLAGVRLELRDETGRVCEATIGPMLPRDQCLRSGARVAELIDRSGDCGGGFYGVTPGATVATVKVGKATPAIEAAAGAAFDEDTGRMANEKQQLEGLDRGAEILSTRVLQRDGAGALVLVYSLVHGDRTIDVYQLATDDPPTVRVLSSLRAPSPSRVIGADLDGDGLLDAIIAHGSGVAAIYGGGDAISIGCR